MTSNLRWSTLQRREHAARRTHHPGDSQEKEET